MKSKRNISLRRASVIAVSGALSAVFCPGIYAAETSDEVRELTQPKNQIEVGGVTVDRASAKFGEYTGLNKDRSTSNGGFELYSPIDDSAWRWRFLGTNLGLDNRSVLADGGKQGTFRLSFVLDEIPRRYSDTYQTLWVGAGGNTLTLPSSFPAASTRASSTTTTAGLLANWNNFQSPNATATTPGGGPASIIPAAMHNFDVGTDRRKTAFGVSIIPADGWEIKAGFRHDDRSGTKLTGVAIGGQRGALLPEPISSNTNQFDTSVAYVGEKVHVSLGYVVSIFKNDTKLWTADSPYANNAVLGNQARMTGAPNNDMNQIVFTGGYKFSSGTRLTINAVSSHLNQNDNFIALTPAYAAWVIPVKSANAKVLNTSFLAKFSSRLTQAINFNASYKYDDRDNTTPTNNFLVSGPDQTSNPSLYTNEPNHRRTTTFTADADYRFSRGNVLTTTYERQTIDRHGSTYEETPFRAEQTTENLLRLEYRTNLSEDLGARFSYAYSERKPSSYVEGDPRPVNPAAPLPGADPLLPGFRQFWLAERKRDKIRSSVNYQASETVSLQAGLDFNKDKYDHSQYGTKLSQSLIFNTDASYAASEKLSLNAFYTYEDMKLQQDSLAISRGLSTTVLVPHVSGGACAPYTNVSGQLPADYYTDPCRQWSETQADKVSTFGLGFRSKGWFGDRLDVIGNLTYARTRTPISITGGAYYNSGIPNSPVGNVWVPAQSLPDITSSMTDLRLTGTYTVDQSSQVRIGYQYRRLKSSDWQYDAYANAALGVIAMQAYLGNGMTSPNYNVQAISATYIFRFR